MLLPTLRPWRGASRRGPEAGLRLPALWPQQSSPWAQRVWQALPSCFLEERLLTESDLTGLGKFSIWSAFRPGGKANIWLHSPLGPCQPPHSGIPGEFHHFSISFPPHLAERWPLCPPSRPGNRSRLSPVSAPGPDGNFPVALCGLQSYNLPPNACRLSCPEDFPTTLGPVWSSG